MALGAEVEAEKTTGAQEDGSAPLEPNHDQLSPSYIAAISAVPAPVPDQASSGDAQGSRYSRHRGIFPGLVLIKTVEQPMAYGRNFKWLITFLVSGAAAIDPISSTIFYRKHLPIVRLRTLTDLSM